MQAKHSNKLHGCLDFNLQIVSTKINLPRILSEHLAWEGKMVDYSMMQTSVGASLAWAVQTVTSSLEMVGWGSVSNKATTSSLITFSFCPQSWHLTEPAACCLIPEVSLSVFEIIGKSHIQGQKRTQRLRCAVLWQNVTWLFQYF